MPVEENEKMNVPVKSKIKDKSFRFLMSQIVVSAIALLIVIVLKFIGGDICNYSINVFKENFDKKIDISQVLNAEAAKKVIAAQSTVYGQGGESDDDGGKYVESYDELSEDVSSKLSSADVNLMSKPVSGTVTCEFGYRTHPITGKYSFHKGIDIGANGGSDIYSALSGTVSKVVNGDHDYGKYIIITHSDGVETMYAHCSKITAKKGHKIKKGDKIAMVGSTGLSTGPHLHFEIRVNGIRLNPRWFIEF